MIDLEVIELTFNKNYKFTQQDTEAVNNTGSDRSAQVLKILVNKISTKDI
jgi:hypothetical protein